MTLKPPPFIREHVPLAGYTTIGLGGMARFFAPCANEEAIIDAVRFARASGLPFVVLGGGSNVIIADAGFDGVVLHIETSGIQLEEKEGGTFLTVAAGEPWDGVVVRAIAGGLAGIECLSGIPGSAGATPIQNVGAYGQEVAGAIVNVAVLDSHSLAQRSLSNAECEFAYRSSLFKKAAHGDFIVTSATYRLTPQGAPTVAYSELQKKVAEECGEEQLPCGRQGLTIVREAVLSLRRRKSMVIDPSDPNTKSVGSYFTNPVVSREEATRLRSSWPEIPVYPSGEKAKLSAAWLVEHAGFPRGYAAGGAAVSEHHALALVNRGTTTTDLLALATRIQESVWKTFAVRIEREPVFIG